MRTKTLDGHSKNPVAKELKASGCDYIVEKSDLLEDQRKYIIRIRIVFVSAFSL